MTPPHKGFFPNIQLFHPDLPNGDILDDNPKVERVISLICNQGMKPISVSYILYCFAYAMKEAELELPFPGEYLTAKDLVLSRDIKKEVLHKRSEFIRSVADTLKFVSNNNRLSVEFKGKDITDLIRKNRCKLRNFATEIGKYSSIIGYATEIVKDYAKNGAGYVIFITNKNLDKDISLIVLTDQLVNYPHLPHAKYISSDSFIQSIQREQQSSIYFRQTSANLDCNLSISKSFTAKNWPHYPLMAEMKKQVAKELDSMVADSHFVFDHQDLIYQILFRLTTVPPKKLFGNQYIVSYLLEHAQNWRKLERIKIEEIKSMDINRKYLRKIISEQVNVTINRLAKSKLPLSDILNSEMVKQPRGKLVRSNGKIYFYDSEKQNRSVINFKPISVEMAMNFHNELHYIHCARCELAFGLFMNNEELPFSVLSLQKIDREYKRKGLLCFGYNPDRCIEFTRLYNWPGSPLNTTSIMFSEAFGYLRKHYPYLEAAITAFMPTYSSGLSMLTGGFNIPIILKPNIHSFQRFRGNKYWEHAVNRNLIESKNIKQIKTKMPLLPVIELLSPIKQPLKRPLLKLGRDIINLT